MYQGGRNSGPAPQVRSCAMATKVRFMAESLGADIRKCTDFWTSCKLVSLGILALVATMAVFVQSSETVGASTQAKSKIDILPGVGAVQSAIVSAERAETLNQNLVSQLASEANSRFVDSCASEPGQSNDSPAAVACNYGDASAPEAVVLYGDSYIEQWLPAFDALGKQYHFKVVAYVRYGCPFATVTERDYLGSVDPGCATFRQNVIAAINAMVPPPSLTLLSEAQLKVELGANGSTMSFKSWANGVRTTLEQLHVSPLGVLFGTPIATNTPNTCLSARLTRIQLCATPTSEAFSVTSDRDDEAAVVASHDEVVNLSSLFCGSRCPEVIDDQLVFADDDHVDRAYALQLGTAFGSLVGCIGTEVPAAESPPGGVLQSLLGGMTGPPIAAACKAAANAPYNL